MPVKRRLPKAISPAANNEHKIQLMKLLEVNFASLAFIDSPLIYYTEFGSRLHSSVKPLSSHLPGAFGDFESTRVGSVMDPWPPFYGLSSRFARMASFRCISRNGEPIPGSSTCPA